MLFRSARPFELTDALHGLADRAFRCSLHRLRGVQALLAGWAEIGTGPSDRDRLRKHQEEGHALLARIEWLHGLQGRELPLARLTAGEAPKVLLAAALLHATPEEAGDHLPQILDPEAAIALACWLQTVLANERADSGVVRSTWHGGTLEVRVEPVQTAELGPWNELFGGLLLEQEDARVVFRPTCFRPAAEVDVAADPNDRATTAAR